MSKKISNHKTADKKISQQLGLMCCMCGGFVSGKNVAQNQTDTTIQTTYKDMQITQQDGLHLKSETFF
jgi:hypothetical protein